MGAGASARDRAPIRPLGAEQKDGNGTVDMVEGGMNWLLHVVDKEKQEKEWLASKYDERCAEVSALREELANLRKQMGSNCAAAGLERQRTPPIRGMAPDVMGKAAGDTAAFPRGAASSQLDVVSPSSGSKLKERRGLKLSIETPHRNGTKHVPADGLISPVMESKDEENGSGPGPRGQKVRTVPGQPDGNSDNDFPSEPMSALLRRRSEEWSIKALVADNADSKTLPMDQLHVSSDKVFSMVDEGPASPKRIVRGRDKGY